MSIFSKFTKHADKGVYPWSQKKLNVTSPLPRGGHSADQVALGNDIYLFGGIAKGQPRRDLFIIESIFGGEPRNPDEKCDENLYVLNINTKQWARPQIDGNLPHGRFGHSAVIFGSRMYIFGGQVDGHYLNDLIAFDVTTLESSAPRWEFIVAGNEGPFGRTGHISAYHGGKIYVFGGTDGEAFYNDIWAYDIQYNAWSQIQATNHIPAPREHAAATIVDDVVYVFGGRGPEGEEYGDLCAFRIRSR
ncbi:hypothetical protein BC938DRAFT_480867 [Jimgerdemannia flammicorona]|uniref:Galactose oxidase n=1 Tax=Jimgerdemannia flammicorona TaxID=994334 RepID=A0A433QHM1_9FUNG|nr:hypothetical protein BC938DRAFT_480867 [Jimgerdemannia flammicorona]